MYVCVGQCVSVRETECERGKRGKVPDFKKGSMASGQKEKRKLKVSDLIGLMSAGGTRNICRKTSLKENTTS